MSKHLKRLLALLLAVVMIVGLFPTVVFAADEAEPETRDLPDSYIVGEDEVPACEPVDEGLPADFNIEDVETELSDGRKLGKIPDLHPGDHELAASGAKRGTLPATYNSNTYNYITSVKNQGNFGTCWAHGALASCEAYMIKNGVKVNGVASTKNNTNLSEYQLAYYAYHDAYDKLGLLVGDKTTPLDDYLDLGGNGWIATYDLMRWEGPVDEDKTTAMRYSNASNSANLGSTYAYQYNVGHVQDAIWIPTKNMSDIKQAIMTYGAGTFGYCHEDEYEQGDGSYYNPNSDYSNHDVTVVGWDDNYSKSKFDPQPSGNGAWIIKNSWGTGYGTSGYYYISYYDVPSKNDYCYFYVVEPVDNYDHNYQYDGTANIDENSYISAPNNAKFANVFTAKGNSDGKELLEAVAVNVWDTNTSFRIQIYTGGTSTTTPESGTLAAEQNVSFTYEGYHTVKLNTPVTLNEGEKFSVIFQNTSGKTISMPIDKSVTISGWLRTTKNHPSNSTYYSTGSSGGTTTYANYSNTANLRIKAYTSDVEAEPEPCTITLKDNQGNTWRTISATTGTAAELPVYPVGSNTDYTFVGWLASAINNETTTTKPNGLCEPSGDVCSYTPTGNVTLYPCFTTVKTVSGGGTTPTEPKTLTFDLTKNPGSWPTTASSTLTNYTYTLNGTAYTFGLKNVKCNSGYLMLNYTAALGLPAIKDYQLTKVVAKNSGGCSTSTKVGVSSSASSASYISGGAIQTWSTTNSTYTYTLSGTKDNTVYYLYVTNKNAQITNLELTYTPITTTGTGGSTTQTIYVTTASLCNHTYQLKASEAPTCTAPGVRTYECSLCHDTYTESIPALGHTWGSWTPVNDLVHERSCTVSGCDGHEEASHNYTISTSGLTTTYTCTLCNHSYNRTLKSYTVNFSVLGSVTDSESCTEGESVSLPATVTSVEGYEFRGWVAAAVDPETETQPSILTGTYAPSGDTTTITLYALYSRIEGATSGGGDYTLVTNATQLVTGSKVIIAAAGYNYALSTTQNNNNRGQAAITKDTVNDTVSFTSNVAELTLLAGSETGTYAFYDPANNGYLYAPTGGNLLRTADTLNDWTITFTNGVPTLADGTRYLRYNDSASLFSGYASGQKDIALYIQSGSAGTTYFTTNPELPCAHGNKTEYAAVAATCTTAGSAYYFLCNDCGNYYNGNGVKIGEDAATAEAAAAIAALGHNFTGAATQIANNDAFHSVQCTRCSETSTAPHTFGTPTVNGLTQTETCTACGYVKTSELTGYTVTYNVLGKDAQKVTVAQGSSVTLPTASAAIVKAADGYTFAGWVTAAIPDKNNTVNPGTPITGTYTPTGNVTLYALYTKTETTGSTENIPAGYYLAKSAPVSGDKIIIALKNGSDYYALPNGNKSSSASIAGTKITVTNDVATSANTYTFELITNSGNLGIKSTEAANYIGFNSNKISMNGWGDTKYASIAAASNGMFTISSSNNAPRGLSYSGTNFTVSNSGASPVYIFTYQKEQQGTGTTTNYYTTQPAAARYIVTAGTCTNGSVAITDPQADYAAGAQVTLTATPATGFAFSAWTVTGTVDGQDYTSAISGTILTVPEADVTVTATFIPVSANEYTVDTTDITGSGSVTADPAVGEEGDPITLTVAPNTHWTLTSLTVDGTNVTAQISGNTYTFNMPDHDVEVSATFAEDAKYTVTIDPAVVTGGTLSADKTADIYAGETVTLTATPDAHYTFDGWQCTAGGATISGNTFTMPAANVTLSGSFTAEAHISVTFHAYSAESQPVTTAISDKYYNGDTVLAADVPAVEAPNGYVFMGWYGSTYAENASAPAYVTPAGTAIGSTALHFYAVYGKSSAGSSPYFKLSIEVNDTTYYVGERSDKNTYLSVASSEADAAEFGYDVVNGKAYLYYLSGDTKNYIYNTASDTSLSFSTTLPSGSTGFEYWTVEEDGSTITFKNGTGTRYLAFNSDRFSTYTPTATQYPCEFTKIGGPSYDSYTTDPARIAPELTAENDTVIFDRDRAVTFNVLTNDDLDYLDATGVTVTVTGTLPTGVVNNNDGTFTFTPAANQQEVTFTYKLVDKLDSENESNEATVTLKPAERVYYDESDTEMFNFVNGTNAWTNVSDPSLNNLDQNIDLAAYEQENFLMYSGGTAKQVTVTKNDKPYVEFSFAGTGFEIIAAMTNTSGAAKIEVYQGSTKVKGAIVDTYRGYTYDVDNPVTRYALKEVTRYKLVEDKYVAYTGAEGEDITDYTYYRDYVDGAETKSYVENKGNWYTVPEGETVSPADDPNAFVDYIYANGFYVLIEQSSCWIQSDDDDANCYQIPILRMMGLDYGTYKVKVQPIYSAGFDRDNDGSYVFIFDGVNIYDPTNDAAYKYISLNDIVSENGFGSVEIAPCDHETKTDWTFYSAASGNATGEALNRGSFVKRCNVCGEITDRAYFNITTSATPTTIGLTGTSTLSYTPTSDNADVQTILNGLTFTATWTTNDSTVIKCSNGVATAQNKEGSTYAKLGLKVGDVQYASVIKSPIITVANSQPEGYTATFHVPAGASAPAAITQTGASITLPAAGALPSEYDAHEYTFAGWVKSAVAYDDTAPAASDILAEGESVTLNANTDFYALYTYQVGGSGSSNSYKLITDASTLKANDKLLIVGIKDNAYYAIQPYASGNNCKSESVSAPSNATITLANDSTAAIITLGGSSGSWTLYDGAKYLYAAGGTGNNNYLKGAENANDTNAQWTISCAAGGAATIVCVDSTVVRNTMRFNTNGANDPLFACYASGQNDVYLYRQEAASATVYTTDPGHKVVDTESATTPTCTEDGYTGDVICSECGMKLGDGDAIPALGHNYQITSDPGELNTTYTCSVCNDSYIEYYEYAVTYVLQPGVEVSGGSRGEGANVNQITLPDEADIPDTYDAQTYTLVGWATASGSDTETDPSTYEKGETVTISADTTFYPVYSFGSGSGSGGSNYEKVTATSDLTDGQYLIVFESDSKALNGALDKIDVASNTIAVTISNNKIASNTTTNAAAFTFNSSNGSFKSTKNMYIGHTGTSNTLNSATTAYDNDVSIDTDGNAVIDAGGNYVLRFNNGNSDQRFRFYKGTQQPIQLYKLAAGTPAVTTYTFELQQKAPHYSAAITPTRLSLTFEATATLTATLLNNGEPATAGGVSFSSSNNSIVSVDASGKLTPGNTTGTATVTVNVTAPDGNTYTATCTVYVSEQSNDITVNYIGSETGKVYNWGTRGTVATFLTAPTTSYYTGSYSYETLAAMSGDSGAGTDFYGSQLGSAIHLMLVNKQTTQTTYDGTRNLYAYTDCIESDTAHVSGYYTGKTLSSTWDSGSTWNREHVWPSSKCINTNHGADGADIMMLRPEAASDNSGRGNTAFGESSGYYNPDAKYPGKAAAVRGDVARNVLYTLMRWGNTTKFYGTTGVIESRAILIKWMNEDPVDTWELARNDAAQRITGVRNIFVDYPELAYKLLGATMPTNYSTPSSSGVVAEATYSATRPSNYEPVTEGSGGTPNNATRSASAHRAAPTVGTITGGVVIDGMGRITSEADFKEYGPAYGVYLAPGQALVFTLNSEEPVEKPTKLQIGAKAVNGTAAKLDVLNVGQLVTPMLEKSIASAAEQYYDLDVSKLGWDGTSSDVIVLYNDGEGILDVTQLRYPTTDGITLTHNVSKTAAKNAAKMLQIVYGAPVTDPDPIEPTDIDLSFNSAALALQSDIGMIFYVDEAVLNSADNVYASFTKALYNEAGEITGYAEATDTEAEYDEDLGKYFFRFEGINPAELGSAVTATLNGTRDGELITGKTVNYSVLTYINNMYGKVDNAEFRALLADLAAYGEAAQKYVSYNTANLVTDDVTDGLMAYATAEAPKLSSCTAITGEGKVKFTGAYLSLREKVTVCYMIDASEYAGDIADLELRIFDGSRRIGTAAFAEVDGKYIASFSGLNALQMRTVVTAEVYDGDTCVSNTLDYSVESYAERKAAGNDALAALVNAMMNFGISAEKYFAK